MMTSSGRTWIRILSIRAPAFQPVRAVFNSDPCGPSPEEKKERIMKERQQLWAKAQIQRKKFCRLILWANKTKESLEAATPSKNITSK